MLAAATSRFPADESFGPRATCASAKKKEVVPLAGALEHPEKKWVRVIPEQQRPTKVSRRGPRSLGREIGPVAADPTENAIHEGVVPPATSGPADFAEVVTHAPTRFSNAFRGLCRWSCCCTIPGL